MRSRSELWGDLDLAVENSKLEQIMEANRGTPAAWAARAQLARGALQEGLNGLGSETSRSGAIAKIEKARDWYGQLAKEATDDVELQREAMLGMAKAEESLIAIPKAENAQEMRGNLDKALDLYKQTASKFPDTLQGNEAAKRAKEIEANKDKVLAFYQNLNKALTVAPPPNVFTLPKGDSALPPFPPIDGPKINPPTIGPLPDEPKPKPELAPLPHEDGKAPKPESKEGNAPAPRVEPLPKK
jgi:hypothetical protein